MNAILICLSLVIIFNLAQLGHARIKKSKIAITSLNATDSNQYVTIRLRKNDNSSLEFRDITDSIQDTYDAQTRAKLKGRAVHKLEEYARKSNASLVKPLWESKIDIIPIDEGSKIKKPKVESKIWVKEEAPEDQTSKVEPIQGNRASLIKPNQDSETNKVEASEDQTSLVTPIPEDQVSKVETKPIVESTTTISSSVKPTQDSETNKVEAPEENWLNFNASGMGNSKFNLFGSLEDQAPSRINAETKPTLETTTLKQIKETTTMSAELDLLKDTNEDVL